MPLVDFRLLVSDILNNCLANHSQWPDSKYFNPRNKTNPDSELEKFAKEVPHG